MLLILHLSGYKISIPTLLARITREELEEVFRGFGWTPYFVEGHEPRLMHEATAAPPGSCSSVRWFWSSWSWST